MCTLGEAGRKGHRAVGEGGAPEPLPLVRPTCGVGRPQGGPLGAPLWPVASSTVRNFENMVHRQKFARKYFQINFQRIMKLKKYFWYFWKKGKVLEKFQRAENNFENFKHTVDKNK